VCSPDGRHIVSGSEDGTTQIWDAKTGDVVGDHLDGLGRVTSVAYTPDGRHIISASNSWIILIWAASNGAAVGEPLGGHADLLLALRTDSTLYCLGFR